MDCLLRVRSIVGLSLAGVNTIFQLPGIMPQPLSSSRVNYTFEVPIGSTRGKLWHRKVTQKLCPGS